MAQLVKNLPAKRESGRPGFNPWVGKIPWRREWLPTPVFWPGEFRGLDSPWGHKESDMTKRLSLYYLNFKDEKIEAQGVEMLEFTAPERPN